VTNLAQVVVQLQKEKKSIETQLSKITGAVEALKSMGRSGAGRTATAAGPRRVMSASARRRIAAAQRARWSKWRALKKRAA
jgi:hypothetical protein